MKKIILTVAIVSAAVGLSSCGMRDSVYSPGNSNYVYSSSYNPNAYRYYTGYYNGYRYNTGYYNPGLRLGFFGVGWNNANYGRGWGWGGNRWSGRGFTNSHNGGWGWHNRLRVGGLHRR